MTKNSISNLVLGTLAALALALAIGTTSSASAQWHSGSGGYGHAERRQAEAHGPMPVGGYYGGAHSPRVVTPPVHGGPMTGGWGGRGDHGGWAGRGDHGWGGARRH